MPKSKMINERIWKETVALIEVLSGLLSGMPEESIENLVV
jgi:hypothetical protein